MENRRQFIRAGLGGVGGFGIIEGIRNGAALSALALPALLRAQTYPGGRVTIVLPLQVGSASDIAVRHLAERLSARIGTPLVVENVVGAAGLVGLDRVAKAKPDGYTIAALNNSIMTILPHLQASKLRLDPRKEMVAIAGIANIPTFLGVKKASPFKGVRDLVAYAKANPEKLMYASGGVGSPQHLASEMLSAYSGAKFLHIPYKGASQAALALASGEVDLMTIALSLAIPFLAEGRVQLIAYCGTQRHAQYPDIPTLREQGISDYDYSSWIALFAPQNTPQSVLDTLRKHALHIAADRDFHQQLAKSGLEAWERSPDALQRTVEEDWQRWATVVKVANIPPS